MTIFWGLMIPFIGTTLGALCVLFIKNELKPVIQKSLLGFAAGVMIAASFWSLLSPSIDMARNLKMIPWLVSFLGFFLGGVLLFIGDKVFDKMDKKSNRVIRQ